MNYTKLFYWLTVADNAKSMFVVGIIIFSIVAGVSLLVSAVAASDGDDDLVRAARKWIWWATPFLFVFWSLFIFTPSKKDALLIVAGGQTLNFLTTDEAAKKIPSELTNFVVTELKNMATEAKVELNIKTQKERILEEAKKMTTDQLIQKMSIDTTFARVILNK